MKILIYLVAMAVVVGGVVMLLGGGPISESPADVSGDGVASGDAEFVDEGVPEEEAGAPFPATSLYTGEGFIDCTYFWNDVRAACPEVKQTEWNSNEPWDINAGPETCRFAALGSEDGEFAVNVSRSASVLAADSVFASGKAGFATLGMKTIDVDGLGEKAYTVPDPYSDVQTGYNFNAKKGAWLVDVTSSNPSFCTTKAQTEDVVQRIFKKLP